MASRDRIKNIKIYLNKNTPEIILNFFLEYIILKTNQSVIMKKPDFAAIVPAKYRNEDFFKTKGWMSLEFYLKEYEEYYELIVRYISPEYDNEFQALTMFLRSDIMHPKIAKQLRERYAIQLNQNNPLFGDSFKQAEVNTVVTSMGETVDNADLNKVNQEQKIDDNPTNNIFIAKLKELRSYSESSSEMENNYINPVYTVQKQVSVANFTNPLNRLEREIKQEELKTEAENNTNIEETSEKASNVIKEEGLIISEIENNIVIDIIEDEQPAAKREPRIALEMTEPAVKEKLVKSANDFKKKIDVLFESGSRDEIWLFAESFIEELYNGENWYLHGGRYGETFDAHIDKILFDKLTEVFAPHVKEVDYSKIYTLAYMKAVSDITSSINTFYAEENVLKAVTRECPHPKIAKDVVMITATEPKTFQEILQYTRKHNYVKSNDLVKNLAVLKEKAVVIVDKTQTLGEELYYLTPKYVDYVVYGNYITENFN